MPQQRPQCFIPAALSLLLLTLCGFPAALAEEDPIRITGRVERAGGGALQGGTVRLIPVAGSVERGERQLGGHLRPEPVVERRLEEDGRFQLPAPHPGLWIVEVHVPGFRAMEHWLQPLLEDTDLPPVTLEKARKITVTVLDSAGRPVPDAAVAAERENASRSWGTYAWRGIYQFARTDAKGRADLFPTADIPAEIWSFSPLYGKAGKEDVEAGQLELRLPKGELRTFEVHQPGGKPAPEVLVVVDSGWTAGFTDQAGRFTVAAPSGEPLAVALYTDQVRLTGLSLPALKPVKDGAAAADPVVFTLPAVCPLQGRVLDARDRRPIPRAFGWIWNQEETSGWSDADGAITLNLPETGATSINAETPRLTVAARGYLRQWATPVRPDALPTVLLQPAAVLVGRVVDEAGRAVAGAEVRGFATTDRRGRRMRDQEALVWTDDRGRFQLRGLSTEAPYELKVVATGFAPAEAEALTPAAGQAVAPLEIVLLQGRRATGRVIDTEDTPVAGARVSLWPALGGSGPEIFLRRIREGDPSQVTVTTDGDGRFTFADLAGGHYDLEVAAEGFAPTRVRGVEIPDRGDQAELGTVILEPGVALSGRVVDPDGQPLEGAQITVSQDRFPGFVFRPPPGEDEGIRSDVDGHFVVEDLRPESLVNLSINLQGYLGRSMTGVGVPPEEPLTVVLEPAATLTGKVVDEQGDPVSQALVLLVKDGAGFRAERHHGVVEEEGHFEIQGLKTGNYQLMVRSQGYLPVEDRFVEVVVGKTIPSLTITLRRGATVEGRVVSAQGEPVPGAHVGILQQFEGDPMRNMFSMVETDGDGHYRLEGVPLGPLDLEANHRSHARTVRSLEVQPGSNRLDFTLEGGLEVSGRVLSTTGEPIAGAAIRLRTTGGPGGRMFAQDATSGADGAFRIESVPRGTYQVAASRDGWASSRSETEVVVTEEPVLGLEIFLDRGATITGRVTGLEFEALAGVQVHGFSTTGDMLMAEVDYRGSYRLGPAGSGTWTVRAAVSGTGEQVTETVEVEEGAQEVTLDLVFGGGLTLSGTVTRGGEPLPDIQVQIMGLGNGKFAFATTNFAGAFRASGLEEGDYRVTIADYRSGLQHIENVSLTADQEIEVEVGSITVRGVVRSTVDGSPLARADVTLTPEPGSTTFPGLAPTTVTDSRGTFAFESVSDGSWKIRAALEGYAPAEQAISVAGVPVEGLEIGLEPTRGLEIDVLLPDGRPADSAFVALVDDGGQTITSGTHRTGEGGRIRLDTAPAGRWWLQVSGHGLGAARQQVEVPGPPVQIRLPASGWLNLRVPTLETSPVPATVSVRGSDGSPYMASQGFSFGQTPGQIFLYRGKMDRLPLPAGSWNITVTSPVDGRTWQGTVQVTAGVPVDLVLE